MSRMMCLPVEARVGLSRIIAPAGKFPPATSRLRSSWSRYRTGPFWPEPRTPTRVVAGALALRKVFPPSVEYCTSSVVANVKMIGSGHVAHGGTGQFGGHGGGGTRWINHRVITPLASPDTGNTVCSSGGLLKLPTGGNVSVGEKTSCGVVRTRR